MGFVAPHAISSNYNFHLEKPSAKTSKLKIKHFKQILANIDFFYTLRR